MPVSILTDAAFAADVLAFPGLAVVDIWAEWCTPCRALAPVFETLAERYGAAHADRAGGTTSEQVRILKLDADANPEVVTQYDVRALPTVLLFQGGVVVERLTGARALPAYVDAIEAQLAKGNGTPAPAPIAVRGVTAAPAASASTTAIDDARALMNRHEPLLVLKHSNSCPVSFTAKRQYDEFVAANPDVPTRLIVVQQERPLSQALETVSGIRHESPQALLLHAGRVLWHASHGNITVSRLQHAVGQLPHEG